jgi:hypothetical protein
MLARPWPFLLTPISTMLLLAISSSTLSQTPAQAPRTPVVVELFTSEGCSSCPPADALLAQLDPVPGADIIALGEHVDYWDGQGWRDRFSSPSFTQRQRDYQFLFKLDDSYTPQAVVNGSTQFNGANRTGIAKAIHEAEVNTIPLELSSVRVHGNTVTFGLLNGPATYPEYVNVYAALVDPTDATEIHGGENNNRTLHHAGVVRTLAVVGGAWHMNNLAEHPFSVQLHAPGSVNGMRLVVFAQTKHIGPILGAVSCVLGTGPAPRVPADAPFPANPCPTAATTIASAQ